MKKIVNFPIVFKANVCVLSLIAMIAISNNSYAASTGARTVNRILYRAFDDAVFFTLNPASEQINPDGCSNSIYYRVSAESADKIYKMLLTAKASGQTITAGITGCIGSYPAVDWVSIRD